ncbi:MAG: acyl-CoA dehydrogenase family protein, partial [Thermodesulfobacteriota bacterium]|nr:acyl-CoA dehydrogenase family protein [Thermodesulfobacteriota bacterium]
MIPYTDEQKMIKEMVGKLAKEKIEPLVEELDKKGEGADKALKILIENDLLKLNLPEEYGGINANYTTMALVIEEMAKVDSSMAMYIFTSAAGLGLLLKDYINEDQKKKIFTSCQSGDKLGGFLMTEPGYGSDAGNMGTRALLKEDFYIVNGTKTMITNGPEAEWFILFAHTGPGEKSRGISCFLFHRDDATGLTAGKPFDKLGFRASKTSEIFLEDARIPKDSIVLKEGDGWGIAAKIGGCMRASGAASIALGNAEGAMEYAIKYAKERITFGKPLIHHQVIQFMIADMGIQIE